MAGTENQCLGLAEALGLRPEVKRIRVRAPWRWLPPKAWWCALAALSPAGDRLSPPWPDVLIASGRKAAAPALALRTASAGAAALRPLAISTSGQGGASRSPRRDSAASGRHHALGGSQRQGARTAIRLTDGLKPSASARPRHWFSVPAMPSLTTQQVLAGTGTAGAGRLRAGLRAAGASAVG